MSVSIGSITQTLPAFLTDKSYSNVFVLLDKNTKKHCYSIIKPLLPKHSVLVIETGEENKNLETCSKIWSVMTNLKLDRHALFINLGGGVIGDMGGFCAATYKRGIDFITIPTTLLAQVDASVGGKLGIDFNGFKNHLGVFSIPKTVLIDPVFLKTLNERELRSGFAEIIKHCLIKDSQKWQEIKVKDLQEQNFEDLIKHSVDIKQAVVAEDPTEKGVRKILNFGHTIGHAVETYFLDKGKAKLLHGEAIAVGMLCEAFISFDKNMISEKTLSDIEEFVFTVYGKVSIMPGVTQEIITNTMQDKKNRNNKVLASLLGNIGECIFDIEISKKDMQKALDYYIKS